MTLALQPALGEVTATMVALAPWLIEPGRLVILTENVVTEVVGADAAWRVDAAPGVAGVPVVDVLDARAIPW